MTVKKLDQLSPLVYLVLGCNPSTMTLQGTNTYLVGKGKKKILIDTGEPMNAEYIKNLKEALARLGDAEISAVICTHWHLDHVGGTECIWRNVVNKDESVNFYKFPRPNRRELFQPSCGFKFVQDGQVFQTEGATLRVLFTPGHSDDHICLYLAEENALFSGDNILGDGTTVFEDLSLYVKSLEIMRTMTPTRIYPGHGPVIHNGAQRIQMYINHRSRCDTRIIEILQRNIGPLSTKDIVRIMYHGLESNLLSAAESNTYHHIRKLEKENKIVKLGGDKWAFKMFS